MSHTVRRKAGLKDLSTIQKAIQDIPGAVYKGVGTAEQYEGEQHGHRISLPGFTYDVVIDANTGDLLSDTWEGRWGNQALLDKLCQRYAVQAAKTDACENGRLFEEQLLPDGAVECTITLGGQVSSLEDPFEGPGGLGSSLPTL